MTVAGALVEDLVAANRILAEHGVVDGYGHVSVRSPDSPERYLLARSIAPASVTAADIMEFDLASEALDPRGRATYLERFIHGEIYRVRPDVRAVVHNHSPSVIPFGVTSAPLRPLYHMSAFVGAGVPIFEIRDVAGPATDLLIRTPALGRALAKSLGDRPCALLRGHGCVVVGDSLPQVVARSIYLELNARLQVQAMTIAGRGGRITYLEPGEVTAVTDTLGDYRRAWDMWRAAVRTD
jgi:ribulose-5-phosphate 4-epimerase/fuculose-1-phosphate aldolase